MSRQVHVELLEAGSAESVPAMNHYPRNTVYRVVTLLAQRTIILVQQLIHELVDLFPVQVRRVLRLLEEKCGRVFQFFCH